VGDAGIDAQASLLETDAAGRPAALEAPQRRHIDSGSDGKNRLRKAGPQRHRRGRGATLGGDLKASGYSFGNARHRIYILFLIFLHVFHPISPDRSPSGCPLGDLGPRIRWLHWHARVLGLGQSSAECCCAIWKASTAVCRKQMRNDVDSEVEGAGDSAMGMCRGRNSMKEDVFVTYVGRSKQVRPQMQ
jgi:hypothetical protein